MELSFSSTTTTPFSTHTPASQVLLFPKRRTIFNDRNQNPCSFSVARFRNFAPLKFSQTEKKNKTDLFKVLSAEKGQVHVVEARRVDELYDALVSRVLPPAAVSENPNFKHLVGLAGPPGAGKSTLAHEVARIQGKHMLEGEGSVYVPSFDHGVGDPVENDIFVNLQHKVVIVEGNYLLLEYGIWKEISSLFDEKWFIDIDIDKAMQRVLKRHISTVSLS
ncbi:hypothetical protein RIF29_40248 [Crotalaria pallida]|uniref:Uncharacterized protein n=1 Tax=Crotalaria pallida TaxID=3830 RepID=A0AAN9E3C1_CROPI